ncbi:hypothetical protein H5410_009494 [Solanum commersonii]|uniref:Uncharacterized protein n=1 Tax=Solanum commersonii TaxID=4109 RepID=A0A9J6AIW7_SOLCO|nr:hypothetical protein H5410_009494 [Solanum commersonii]
MLFFLSRLSKIVVVPVLDSSKCSTFAVLDTHPSGFLKSPSIAFLRTNQSVYLYCFRIKM